MLAIPEEVWTAAFEGLSPEATEAMKSEFAHWGPLIGDDPLELSPAAAEAFEEFDRLIAEQGYKFLD